MILCRGKGKGFSSFPTIFFQRCLKSEGCYKSGFWVFGLENIRLVVCVVKVKLIPLRKGFPAGYNLSGLLSSLVIEICFSSTFFFVIILNSFQDNKIQDWSKLKAFVDNILNAVNIPNEICL